MKVQRVRTNRQTGRIEHFYEDQGPGKAVLTHDRPVFQMTVSIGLGHRWPAGSRQQRLRSPAS